MKNKFIVLRGPSGAGKSTIANILKEKLETKTLIIEQDYFNHQLFKGMDDEYEIIPKLIKYIAESALSAGYNVILEGVLRKEKYMQTICDISNKFQGSSFIYYFNISPEETIIRHSTRDKAQLFNAEEMLKWYDLASPLGISNEIEIKEPLSEKEIIFQIIGHND